MVRELRAEGVLEDAVGLAEPGLHVSQLEPQNRLNVGVRPLLRRAFIGAGILVHEGGAGLERVHWIEDGGEILVLDLDECLRLFRDVRIERGHHRDLFADEADTITGQQWHVEHAASHQDVREIRGREHREDAGKRPGLGRVDLQDLRVRQRASKRFAPDEPGERHVRGIPRRTADLLGAVEPSDALSNDPVCHAGAFR